MERFDVFCPHCHYNLRGTITIAGARCSECGELLGFDELEFKLRLFHWKPKHTRRVLGVLMMLPVIAALVRLWVIKPTIVSLLSILMITFIVAYGFLWMFEFDQIHQRDRLAIAVIASAAAVLGGAPGLTAWILIVCVWHFRRLRSMRRR